MKKKKAWESERDAQSVALARLDVSLSPSFALSLSARSHTTFFWAGVERRSETRHSSLMLLSLSLSLSPLFLPSHHHFSAH